MDDERDGRETGVRTLVIGIDAACRTVLEPLFAAGAVPNLASVFEAGASGELTSQVPPWTPSAWPSIYTGVNPGKHGVFGFLTFDGYDWDVVDGTDVRERTLWELLDHHGLSSVVVNAPVTHPAPAIDGAIVPGYVAPERPTCHPEGLLSDLRAELGEYRVYARREGDATATAERQRLVAMRGEAFRYLCERFEPEFGFLQFQQTDTVFHERPGDQEAVRAVYEAVDEQVGATLAACDPETVLVVSDHGIGRYGGREFRVNERLRREGFVETVGGEGMPGWDAVLDGSLRDGETTDDGGRGSGALERALALAARAGVTSQRVGAVLETVGLDELVLDHVPRRLVRAGTERVDFANSAAYVRSRIECGVRLNLEGREPDGVVPPEEYEAVRSELIDRLSAVRTPGGDPVFEDVAPREQYFHGPHADAAVDIVTVPAEFDHFLSAQIHREEFAPPGEPWNHKRDGVVAASGAGIDAAAGVGDARLFDVAPTVLATFGLPRDERMDGRPLPFVADAGERSYAPYEAGRGEYDAERGDVEARLSRLGYIE